MKRRDFIHKLSHAAASPFVLPPFINDLRYANPNSILNNTAQQGNIIVLVKLNGGNDGLNTVIPLDQYQNLSTARPHVILPENRILQLGDQQLGLHPSLTNFKSLYDEGRMKIIQNVGYSNPDFSHFRSMDIWETGADANQYLNSGWMGRYIENQHPDFPQAFPNSDYPHPLSVEIGSPSLLFTGQSSFTSYIAQDPQNFEEIINEFDNVYANDKKGMKLDYIQLVSKQSNAYGRIIRDTYRSGTNTHGFNNSWLGQQFSIVSKLISGGLNTRIYMVELGGFDTHDTQVDINDHTQGQHTELMRQLNDTVFAFMRNMDAIGRSDDVLVMTYSEFGRTIVSNGSRGTDHGTAAPLFVFGNKVDPEILGQNPVIPPNVRWQDNLEAEFDYRQIYSSVMAQWLNTEETARTQVLNREFDQVSIIQDRYRDADSDGVPNAIDLEPQTPRGAVVDLNGVQIFTLPTNNYTLQATNLSCSGKTDGAITMGVRDRSHVYRVELPELNQQFALNAENDHQLSIDDLAEGTYQLNIFVEGQTRYQQNFTLTIGAPPPLKAKTSVNYTKQRFSANLSGATRYHFEVNGKRFSTQQSAVEFDLQTGLNSINISTDKECQGVVQKEVFISEELQFFPNPVVEDLNIIIPGIAKKATIRLYQRNGRLLSTHQLAISSSRMVSLPMGDLTPGLYLIKVATEAVVKTLKVQKK